jgi:hypothetical protein
MSVFQIMERESFCALISFFVEFLQTARIPSPGAQPCFQKPQSQMRSSASKHMKQKARIFISKRENVTAWLGHLPQCKFVHLMKLHHQRGFFFANKMPHDAPWGKCSVRMR